MKTRALSSFSFFLIIVAVILGPVIIFQFLVPSAGKGIGTSSACLDPRLTINERDGYTCYDAANRQIRLQIKRGQSQYTLVGIVVLATINGKSEKFDIDDDLIGVNEEIVYTVPLNSSIEGDPQQVSIAPFVNKDGVKVLCGISSRAKLSPCNE